MGTLRVAPVYLCDGICGLKICLIFFKLFPIVGLFSFACLFVLNLLLFNCELPKAVVAITLYYRYTKVV